MKYTLLSCVSFVSLFIPHEVNAQTNSVGVASSGSPSVIEEGGIGANDDILVTARRRAERIQDVPLSVSAVTSETLAQNNITSAVQLSRAVPSLVSSNSGGGGRALPIFSIRGLRA